jgi:hypothetical protein
MFDPTRTDAVIWSARHDAMSDLRREWDALSPDEQADPDLALVFCECADRIDSRTRQAIAGVRITRRSPDGLH